MIKWRVEILRLLDHVFRAAVPQIVCKLMEKSFLAVQSECEM